MKINRLIILILFVGLTGFNLGTTFDFHSPSITVSDQVIEQTNTGKVVILSLSLCSSENLESFSIKPDKAGLNNDSDLEFIFNNNSKQASVNYYYSVPEDVKELKLNLSLKDAAELTKRQINVNLK